MKTLRRVLILFMIFFCIVSVIPFVREVRELVRGFGDPSADMSRLISALIARVLVTLSFAWFAIAMWKKNRLPEKPT